MQTAPEDVDFQLSNLSCRILVISPTVTQATLCISRIQNESRAISPSIPSEPLNESVLIPDPSGSPSDLIKIPWTITNRYYSALVHFAAHAMHGLSPHQVQNIPAIIFVWSRGESYKHHIERIAHDLSGCEPEVCLAVRTQPQELPTPTAEEEDQVEVEDDSEIDAFLSSHGFEYIDATKEPSSRSGEEDSASNLWSEGIPGLPRVLDALSTIMWSSMQPRTKDTNPSKKRERERALLDWAHSSQDHSLPAVEEVVAKSSNQLSQRTKSLKNEMQELARWLEDDEPLRDDPWKAAASSGGMTTSPTTMAFGGETPSTEQTEPVALGFDDDFTVFVSAPAVEPAESSGRSTPDAPPGGLSAASAAIPHAGDLYRSLGSVSDFGGSDDGKDTDNGGMDDDLPTKEEILATSARIFGPAKFPPPPDIESRTTTATPATTLTSDELPAPSKVPPKIITDPELESFTTESVGEDGDESYDMEPFDLSKVLSALQEMKAEIASMENEGERRKAAAKVALGLVYGLEADTESL